MTLCLTIQNMQEGSSAIFDAIQFAASAHFGQLRKGTRLPYILHPLNAAKLLLESGLPDCLAVAALLHDVLEDTPVEAGQIRERFGDRVTELVVAVTEPDKSKPWEERKQHTIRCLEITPDLDVLYVAIADKIDNVRSIREDRALRGDVTWDRFRRGRHQQRWYYECLVDVFERRLNHGPGARLVDLLKAEFDSVFGEEETVGVRARAENA